MELIDKDAVLSEIRMYKDSLCDRNGILEDIESNGAIYDTLGDLEGTIDALEVMNEPYEQTIQYASIEAGIQAHAEIYSFNIESKLFNQLTKEQQELWREEIEQACISGGEAGIELARDPRYKENLEAKEVDLELNSFDATVCKNGNTYLKEMDKDAIIKAIKPYKDGDKVKVIIKPQKGE